MWFSASLVPVRSAELEAGEGVRAGGVVARAEVLIVSAEEGDKKETTRKKTEGDKEGY